jgi:endonuclease/exonuclease/phosphatase family metal-dependent hydrolase
LRVATFNIRHGRGMDGVVDLRRTADAILRTGADVVALQEVDRLTERTGGLDEPALLEELLGMAVSFWPTLELGTGHFGIALATTAEVDARFESLDNRGAGRPHGVVIATVAGVVVLATHLSTIPLARQPELACLARLASAFDGPAVIAGDLNERRRALGLLAGIGFAGDRRRRATFPSRLPLRQIDHVLAGPGLRVERSWTVKSLCSDHLPLVAEIHAA